MQSVEKKTKVKSNKVTISVFLKTYESFSKEEKQDILKKIYEPVFKQEWNKLDAELPNIEISDKDIMKEIKAVRNAKKKN